MRPLHTDSISWEKSTQRNSTAGKAEIDGFLIMIDVGNYVIIQDNYVVYTLLCKGWLKSSLGGHIEINV